MQDRRLEELANHDGLTGCLTHRAFQEKLASEASRADRYGRAFGVVMADVDRLKNINDTYGHGAGDAALKLVAGALKDAVREVDGVGRLGGDEFAILVAEADHGDIEAVGQRLHASVHEVAGPVPVTVSFGGASWNSAGDTVIDLLRRADDALYEAKGSGRDSFVVHGASAQNPRR